MVYIDYSSLNAHTNLRPSLPQVENVKKEIKGTAVISKYLSDSLDKGEFCDNKYQKALYLIE